MLYVTPFSNNFDSLFDELITSANKSAPSYPPYSIATVSKGDKTLGLIELACAGIPEENIDVYFDEDNFLVIEGKQPQLSDDIEINYSHKGISTKDFKRKFRIDKYYEVKEVVLKDGLLRVFLEENKPEPQKIPITTGKKAKNILAV